MAEELMRLADDGCPHVDPLPATEPELCEECVTAFFGLVRAARERLRRKTRAEVVKEFYVVMGGEG